MVLGIFGLVRDVPVLGTILAFAVLPALIGTFWWGILAFPCPRWIVPRFAREEWIRRNTEGWPWPGME